MTGEELQRIDAALFFTLLHMDKKIALNLIVIVIIIKCKFKFHVLSNPESHFRGAKELQVADPCSRPIGLLTAFLLFLDC